jgi:hypothetical protein
MRSQMLYKRLVAGFVCALCAFFAIRVCAQSVTPPITGDYGGTDIQWFVRLHVRQTPSGSLTGTNDIIDQGFRVQTSFWLEHISASQFLQLTVTTKARSVLTAIRSRTHGLRVSRGH